MISYHVFDKFNDEYEEIEGDCVRIMEDGMVAICRGHPSDPIPDIVAVFHEPAGLFENDEEN